MDNFFIKTFIIYKLIIKKKGAKMFSKELSAKLDKYHLLKHPFYQIYWNEGKLTRDIIKDYAEQYYQHV